jgi:hypothetical protein
MADVATVVDRDPADVDAGLARSERLEGLDPAGQSIVEREGYLSSPE